MAATSSTGIDILTPSMTDGWGKAARPGMSHRPLYADPEAGLFFGWIRFEAMASTGLHKHLGPAFSYIVEGSLFDMQGEVVAGQMGINLSPATHDAIAYRPTLFVARLEAPVMYMGNEQGGAAALHTGARTGEIVHDRPEDLPDINLTVADMPMVPTGLPNVGRRVIYGHRRDGAERRCVQLQMMPGASLPRFTTTDRLDIFVLGGGMQVGTEIVGPGALVAIAPGQEIAIDSRFGALFFAWSDAPVRLAAEGRDPFGF